MDPQRLTAFFNQRRTLRDRLRHELEKSKAKAVELERSNDLDEYDQATTDILALLAVAVQQLEDKPTSSGLKKCMKKVEALRCSHDKLRQSMDELCKMLDSLLTLVVDMEDQLFGVLHNELNQQLVLAGARDHVADVRLYAYYDIIDQDPSNKDKFRSLSVFLDALQQEYLDFTNGRIRTRPLNLEFKDAIQRLGLSLQEWQLLKDLSKGSGALFHKKFTIEELESHAFPAEFEPCREPLLRVAREIDQRRRKATAAAPPSDDTIEP